MSLQFNFENYKSFLEEATLDLTATSIKEHKSNLITYFNDENYVKTLAIYGSNASGKTNIFHAFVFMKYVVLGMKVFDTDSPIQLSEFKLSEGVEPKYSTFEVFFVINEDEYQYGFKLDRGQIYEEWLYKRDYNYKEKYTTVIERDNGGIILSKELEVARELVEAIDDQALIVTMLSTLKFVDIRNVLDWFKQTFSFDFGNPESEFNISKSLGSGNYYTDSKNKARLEEFLKAVDVGIDGVRFELPDDSSSIETNPKVKVYTIHKNPKTGREVEFALAEESSGTKKMFTLYGMLTYALENGSTLLIDELDAKLHPLLTRYIINMFQNETTNSKNAQLIFSVHDTSCLNKDMFRRDQINFVEKDKYGISRIKPLNRFLVDGKKVRNDASYSKDYLLGRYGAIPNLADFLVEEDCDEE